MNVVLVGGHDRQNAHYAQKLKEFGVVVKRSVEAKGAASIVPTSGCDAVLLMRDVSSKLLKGLSEDAAAKAGIPLVRVSRTITETKKALIDAGLLTMPDERTWTTERLEEALQLRDSGQSYSQIGRKWGLTAAAVNSALRRYEKEKKSNEDKEAAKKLAEAEAALSETTVRLESLEARLSETSAWARALEEENEKLSNDKRWIRMEAEVAGANSRAEMAENSVRSKDAEISSLRRSRDSLARRSAEVEQRAVSEDTLNSLREAVAQIESHRDQLRKELEGERSANSELWSDVQELQAKVEMKTEEATGYKSLQREVSVLKAAKAKALRDLQARTDACQALKTKLDAAKVEVSEEESRLRTESTSLQRRIRDLEKAAKTKVEGASKAEIKAALIKGIKIGKSGDTDIMDVLEMLA